MFPKLYPHVSGLRHLDQTAKGPFPGGKPLGVVVHYSADRSLDRTVSALLKQDLGYHIIIDRDGSVIQMVSFDRQCWHAGKAVWAGRSPNHHFLAVSLLSWGYLKKGEDDKFTSWSGETVSASEVAIAPSSMGVTQPWDIATSGQIIALLRLMQFFLKNGIDSRMICGHDECALPPGRKSDPGGVLPFPMEYLRNLVVVDDPRGEMADGRV